MAERKAPVFLVATANQISHLPPELIRKGRFDEMFFVDLPTVAVRADIFRIHLTRRELDPTSFDLPALASLDDNRRLAIREVRMVGDDLRILARFS